jgi:ABC-type transport system substrate-binding protein
MDGRSHAPRIFISAILVVAGTLLLLAAALARPAHSAPAAKIGGTLRVNLSTTDVQYTDPSLEYESTGLQVDYATALKMLNWKETKAQLFPEAATSFPLVSAGGKRYTFHIRPGQRLSNGEKVTARNFQYAFQRAVNARMNSPAAAFLSDLASVRTTAKLTLLISLKRARPDFASIESMPFFQVI